MHTHTHTSLQTSGDKTITEQNTEQKRQKIVRIFYKHIVILIKRILLIPFMKMCSLCVCVSVFFWMIFCARHIATNTLSLNPWWCAFFWVFVCVYLHHSVGGIRAFTLSRNPFASLLVKMTNAMIVCMFLFSMQKYKNCTITNWKLMYTFKMCHFHWN